MFVENLLRPKCCTEDLMCVNSFNFDSLPPLYRGGSEVRNPFCLASTEIGGKIPSLQFLFVIPFYMKFGIFQFL